MKRRNKIVRYITQNVANGFYFYAIIAIEHGFSCINIRQVPWEVLETEAEEHVVVFFQCINIRQVLWGPGER